jgi:RNA polymerase sigma-70 factor (ECF subfamily)
VARRAGLNDTEADEVLQDTLIAVAGKMPEFLYDPAKDSFKGWLLHLTRWRIADQFRKRLLHAPKRAGDFPGDADSARTATVERIPDPAGLELTAIWDEEWEKHLLDTVLGRVKRQVNPAHYEIYYLHVILGKPVSEVKQALGVNAGQIYLATHRVGAVVRSERKKLERSLS